MLPGAGELALLFLTSAILLASGAWTNSHYSRFDRLPAHYDIRGRATRLSSRRLMAWLLPAMFTILLAVMVFAAAAIPAEHRNGDPLSIAGFAALSLLGGQAFVLWLLSRWARTQS